MRAVHAIATFAALAAVNVLTSSWSLADEPPAFHRGDAARECSGEPCDAVMCGFITFVDRRLTGLEGNGRSCADCHMPTNSFQLAPAAVETRFQILKWLRRFSPHADDPLFRPIDADDFRVNGASARDFSNLRQNGLIRITFPLPANIKLIDPATDAASSETFVDLWRMVPSVNDVALTGPDGINPHSRGPNNAGGYQLDARVGTLQEQALLAFVNHAQVQNAPSQQRLDDLAALQRTLFTNRRVRELAQAFAAGSLPLPSADPRLSSFEEQGRVVFDRACAHCHGGPGQSTTPLPVVFRCHDIATQCPRSLDTAVPPRFAFKPCPERLARNERTYEITLPTGTTVRRTSSDPGRALLTGFVGGPPPADDWNKLDVPGLRGIGQTAPYFHNNSADTLEEVVDHYIEFFKLVRANAPPGVAPPVASTDGVLFDRQPTPEERAQLLAYLRRL
jgi:cytochrome c peroxidase